MSATDPIALEILSPAGDTFLGWTREQLEQAADRLLHVRPGDLPTAEAGAERLDLLIVEYEWWFLGGPPRFKMPVSEQAAAWVSSAWRAAEREVAETLRYPLTAP